MKNRILALAGVILLTGITTWLAFYLNINPPIANVAGGFAALFAGVVVSLVFRVPDKLYYLILVFIYFAEPVGSIMNLYRLWAPYDKIVHFFSGVLIAAFAAMLFQKIIDRRRLDYHQRSKLTGIAALFVFFAASAGAGLWEITEFTIDILVSGGMQRGMVDTITDMIAGNLGGLLYGLILYFGYRSPRSQYDL